MSDAHKQIDWVQEAYLKEYQEESEQLEADIELANQGKQCPRCKSIWIDNIGWAPDGFRENNQYRCLSCEKEWEGY